MTTEKRAQQLQWTVKAVAWWMAVQGVFHLVTGDRLASWLSLRWSPAMAPYLRLYGLSLLALALFVHRGVEQARRQYLAVDALLLLLLGRAALTLNQQVSDGYVTGFEWAVTGVDLALGTALIVLRTRSKNMHQAGTLLVMDAGMLVRQTGSWIAGQGPKPKADLGPLDPDAPASPPAQPATLRWADGTAPLMPASAVSALAPPPVGAPVPAPAPAPPPVKVPLRDDELQRLPMEDEKPRSAPLVPPAPAVPAQAPLPPPSPAARGRSEAVPRLD